MPSRLVSVIAIVERSGTPSADQKSNVVVADSMTPWNAYVPQLKRTFLGGSTLSLLGISHSLPSLLV